MTKSAKNIKNAPYLEAVDDDEDLYYDDDRDLYSEDEEIIIEAISRLSLDDIEAAIHQEFTGVSLKWLNMIMKSSRSLIRGEVHYDEDMDISWGYPTKTFWMCWNIPYMRSILKRFGLTPRREGDRVGANSEWIVYIFVR